MNEIVYGFHAIHALLEHNPQRFLNVYILKGRHDFRLQQLIQRLKNQGIIIQIASRQWLNKKVGGAVHQNIIARVQKGQEYHQKNLLPLLNQQSTPLLLVLDSVTDPRNLGACLRCADAAGVRAVIVPRNRSASINATVKKVASGAAETVPLIRVNNLAHTLRFLKEHNIRIVGTSEEANHHLYQSKLTGPLALIMGSEDKGMRRLTREYCNEIISIPMAGTVSSLNVSVATGILLFEAIRQRRHKQP